MMMICFSLIANISILEAVYCDLYYASVHSLKISSTKISKIHIVYSIIIQESGYNAKDTHVK